MFNDTSSLQMILTVVPEEKVEPILAGLKPFLENGILEVCLLAMLVRSERITMSQRIPNFAR